MLKPSLDKKKRLVSYALNHLYYHMDYYQMDRKLLQEIELGKNSGKLNFQSNMNMVGIVQTKRIKLKS